MSKQDRVRLYSHSTIFYWWPVWLVGYVLGALTSLSGAEYINDDRAISVSLLSGSDPGLLFASLILLTIFITSVKLRGLASITLILSVALAIIALAWFGILDYLVSMLPGISVHMTAGFYYFMSTVILIFWLLGIFVFDRLSCWQISAGQLTRVKLIGSAEKSWDARGMVVEHQPDDFLRHVIFGFGSGDLILRTAGDHPEIIELRDILNVRMQKKRILSLVMAPEPTSEERDPETEIPQ